jgi:hypothetical protein
VNYFHHLLLEEKGCLIIIDRLHKYNMTFREFLAWHESLPIKPVKFEPGALIPAAVPPTGVRNSGARVMNLFAPVNPHSPKGNVAEPIFRKSGQQSRRIANKKH